MIVRPAFAHSWNVSPREAQEIQRQLYPHVLVEPLDHQPKIVAGVDASVKGNRTRAAVVLCSYPELVPLQASTAEMDVSFPYIPGLFTFREGPVVLAALEQLHDKPDVLMFDAQGLAHPRRMGIATHLGILLDTPTVGCAKSRLCGAYVEPDEHKGCWTCLMDENDTDQVIGAVVRTRTGVRPIFVSVGHRVNLETAVSLVLGCAARYRLPEPIRWAHRVSGGESLPSNG